MKAVVLLVLLQLLLMPAAGQARTWLVKQDGSGDCTTIQACVDSAQVGDTVLVYPGTYEEHITISSAISLIGQSGSSVTIIDGTNTGRCILLDYIPSPGVLIKGLTIRNGELMEYPYPWENSVGAGIFSRGSVGLVAECVLELIAGMSIGCDETSNMTIESNLMQDNYTTNIEPPYPVSGGGVVTRSSNTIIRNNTFINNMEKDIFVEDCSPQVVENSLLGDETWGGGIATRGPTTAYIAGNLITGCWQPVALLSGTVQFTRNTVVNNRSTGIRVGICEPVISNNIVTGNSTGIDCSHGLPSLYCNDVWNNTNDYIGTDRCYGCDLFDFHLDPQFCAPEAGNFYLNHTSPCLDYPECGQVGAYGMGCVGLGVPDPEVITWGRIKVLFR